jgi:hypothetical protein
VLPDGIFLKPKNANLGKFLKCPAMKGVGKFVYFLIQFFLSEFLKPKNANLGKFSKLPAMKGVGNFVYFTAIGYLFGSCLCIFPFWVFCTKKNLSTRGQCRQSFFCRAKKQAAATIYAEMKFCHYKHIIISDVLSVSSFFSSWLSPSNSYT